MADKLKVYRLGGDSIELDKGQCHLFSRTEMLVGQTCPTKRYYSYNYAGRGVESRKIPAELSLGKAVHAGLETMLRDLWVLDEPEYGGSWEDYIGSCADEAKMIMNEAVKEGIDHGFDYIFDQTPPEVSQLLGEEQANLAYALVWTFGKRRLASLLERYDVVEVEPEINWLVGWQGEQPDELYTLKEKLEIYPSAKAIIMMSRPDAILRSREDGKLWTVSWKTAKRFTSDYLDRLQIDVQSITEGLAVQAKYGEEPGGTFYSYFLKGDKVNDDEIGAKRYSSHLIRPYSSWTGVGEPQYRAAYKWFNEVGAEKRLGKGWARIDIWKSMDMPAWLEMLDSGQVQPEANRDWLGEVVAEPLPMPFKPEAAQEWLKVAAREEALAIDPALPAEKRTGSCLNYNRRCSMWAMCWEGDTVERQLAAGIKRVRVGNHDLEIQSEGDQ